MHVDQVRIAAQRGDAAMVKALVEARADADTADIDGTTPLMMAAECGHLAVVQARVLAQGPASVCLRMLPCVLGCCMRLYAFKLLLFDRACVRACDHTKAIGLVGNFSCVI